MPPQTADSTEQKHALARLTLRESVSNIGSAEHLTLWFDIETSFGTTRDCHRVASDTCATFGQTELLELGMRVI